MKNDIISLSLGKDSTYLSLTENGEPVFFNTGLDFPEMKNHSEKLQNYLGKEITVLKSNYDFIDLMLYKYGWPSNGCFWCRRLKINAVKKYANGRLELIGFAKGEEKRTESNELIGRNVAFPMIEKGITEPMALKYCQDKGFDWGGLYAPDKFDRVSCFCCPQKKIGELRVLRTHFNDLWLQMLDWEKVMIRENTYHGFKGKKSVHDFDRRFAEEDRQMVLFADAV